MLLIFFLFLNRRDADASKAVEIVTSTSAGKLLLLTFFQMNVSCQFSRNLDDDARKTLLCFNEGDPNYIL